MIRGKSKIYKLEYNEMWKILVKWCRFYIIYFSIFFPLFCFSFTGIFVFKKFQIPFIISTSILYAQWIVVYFVFVFKVNWVEDEGPVVEIAYTVGIIFFPMGIALSLGLAGKSLYYYKLHKTGHFYNWIP